MKIKQRVLQNTVMLILLMAASLALSGQEGKPRVAIFPFNVPSGDPGIENLAQAATDTLTLTFQLLNKYEISRREFPSPLDSENVFDDLRQSFTDYAVYGAIEPREQGGYRITAYSWEMATDEVKLGVEIEVLSAFDLFDSMDLATLRFAEDFTGIHIGFGRLVFENATPKEPYIVEIDGNRVGDDVERREVLYGERRISILLPGRTAAEEPYHLVSYLLNIEEGVDYTIPFSIDPNLDRTDWNSALDAPVTLQGSETVITSPRDATVTLNGEILGRTPLVADPMFLSAGGTLLLERDYFLPLETGLQTESLEFDLSVDPSNPYIKPALNRVWLGAATNVLITATQVMFVMLPGMEGKFDQGPPGWPLMLAASPRFGYVLAGDMKTAGILSLASMLSAGLIIGASELEMMDSDLGMILWQLPFWATIAYDLGTAPLKAASDNRSTLQTIKKNGLPDIEKSRRPWISKPYLAVQLAGGSYAMVGGGIDLLKNYLSLDLLAGAAGDYFDPLNLFPCVNTKALFFPAASFDIPVQPYLAGILHLAVDLDTVFLAGATGPALGFEIPLKNLWKLPDFTLFFEAEYYYSPVGSFPMIGMGGKFKP